MPIRALIFDFDGLILDTESTEYQSWQELFTTHGCQLSLDRWIDCIGRPRGYFDFYTHLEEMKGAVIDREQIRTERHARVRELNLLQPILAWSSRLFARRPPPGTQNGACFQ